MLAVVAAMAGGVQGQAISNNTLQYRACQPPFQGYAWCNRTLSTSARASAVYAELELGDYGPLLSARGFPRGNIYNLSERLGAWGA